LKLQINNLRKIIREIIMKESKSIKENGFDRVEYYLDYYKNLTPSDFTVLREDDKIIISNIIK
jgi:hypothetical protein